MSIPLLKNILITRTTIHESSLFQFYKENIDFITSLFTSLVGETLKWMQEHARNLKTCIIGSVAVKQGNNLYNRLYVVKANEVKFYDKRYLFSMAGEDKTFTKGKKELIFDINSWKIKPLICYDLRFPVWSKNKVVEKNHQYDILIYIANWPQKRSAAWTSLLRARAIEN